MVKSSEIIVMEMLEFMQKEGGHPGTWCVGITNDPRRRLFDEHQVDYHNDAGIYRAAASEDEARRVEEYFLAYGLIGGAGKRLQDPCTVYTYRKSIRTQP